MLLYMLTQTVYFEYIILVAIITSCLIVALQPVSSTKTQNDPYMIVDMVLGSIFVLEVAMKAIAHGLILHREAYLRSSWNIFDFTVVAFGKI